MPEHDYAALLAEFRTAILTTRGPDGHLRSRPMAMRQQVRGEEIWFATSIDSGKCRDLAHEPQCALTFFDARGGATISVSGVGEVIRDRKLVHELWDPSWRKWFPAGPDQRDLALLRVMPEHVERRDPARPDATVLFTSARRRRRAAPVADRPTRRRPARARGRTVR
jgi:general stress protein 26